MFDLIFSVANKFTSFFTSFFSFSFFSKKSNHETEKKNKLKLVKLQENIKNNSTLSEINDYDENGELPLYVARQSPETLQALLNNNADPNLPAIKNDITEKSVVDILLLNLIRDSDNNIENQKTIMKLFMQRENIKLKEYTVKSFFSSMYPKTALSYPFHSACFPKIQEDLLRFVCKSNPEIAQKKFQKLESRIKYYIDQKTYLNINDMEQYLKNLTDHVGLINNENEQLNIAGAHEQNDSL